MVLLAWHKLSQRGNPGRRKKSEVQEQEVQLVRDLIT